MIYTLYAINTDGTNEEYSDFGRNVGLLPFGWLAIASTYYCISLIVLQGSSAFPSRSGALDTILHSYHTTYHLLTNLEWYHHFRANV